MTKTHSRKSFLGSMALLTAGVAMGGIKEVITGTQQLETHWEQFCKLTNGSRGVLHPGMKNPAIENPCMGHSVKAGNAVQFEGTKYMALPAWIYWGKNTNRPSDVVISIFDKNLGGKRLFSLNSLELEASLVQLSKGNRIEDLIQNKINAPKNMSKTDLKIIVAKNNCTTCYSKITKQTFYLNKNNFNA